jgi:hypothetical protein
MVDDKFKTFIEGLSQKYQELISMSPVTIDTMPDNCPVGGVYLFSEDDMPLYAGRTKRKIKTRLKGHINTANDCPFAWHLALESTEVKRRRYTKEGSRKSLLTQPEFKQAYEEAKNKIRKMNVRFVGEPDPIKQALLEIYVAVVSGAKFNDFDTH